MLATTFDLPTRRRVDARLAAGAALFGCGWGLAGYCPGPALTALASGHGAPITFVVAMVAGMLAERLVLPTHCDLRRLRTEPPNVPSLLHTPMLDDPGSPDPNAL